jgi:glycosyltransferase involved in cell wall biosynthesis
MPLAVLEAQASGLPVVGSDALGVRFLLEGGAGEVVPVRDPAALAGCLLALVADPARLRSLAQEGRRVATERYGVPAYVQAFHQLFQELAGDQRGDPS